MGGGGSPVPLSTIGYKREELVPSHPSFMNPSASNGYRNERSVSPVSVNSSIDNPRYYNGYGYRREQSTSPVPSHPGVYKRGESGYESHPGVYKRGESGYESHPGVYKRGESGYELHPGVYKREESGYESHPGVYKRGESGYESHPGVYKRGESGYESRAESIQSTPPTLPRRWCNESGYESDGHSNPNSGSLARKAHEARLQRQIEIDVAPPKQVTETLL